MSNLLPRGGGAFVAEMDGNLVCLRVPMSNPIVDVPWHGKFRGPDFAPLQFRLRQSTSEKLKDTDGDPIWTVAEPITDEEKTRGREAKTAGLFSLKSAAVCVRCT
jgi:hypothetical protein